MVSNQAKALKALHKLLVQGRTMAFEGMPSGQLAYFFDDLERVWILPDPLQNVMLRPAQHDVLVKFPNTFLEYLLALMLEEESADEQFSSYLKEICEKLNCSHIFSQYRNGWVSVQ